MIFMSWLAIVFIWFCVTVLRGARHHFAWGALWSAFLILGATHVLNPDAFIAKTNIALMQQGRPFDATYNAKLSDDALPTLMESFGLLNDYDQRTVAVRMANRYCDKQKEGYFRSWNFGRWRASSILNPTRGVTAEAGHCEKRRLKQGPNHDFD